MSKIIDLDYNYEGIKALPYILCKQQGIETWPNEDRLMLLKSVMGKKTYALNKLLNHNFDFGLHENGYNILSIAVQYGTLRDVVTIANKNPELVNKPDNQNKTPLDYTKTADKQYALIKEGALLYNVKDKNLRNYQANIINDLKGLRLSNDLNEMKEQIKIILSNITFLFDKNGASLLSNKVDLVKLNEIFQNICSICSDLALTNNKKCFNIHDFFKKIDFGKIDDVCLKLEEPIKDFLSAIATMHNLLSNPLDKIDLPQSKQVRFAAQRVD